jgi:hypothetical protein
MTGLEAVVETWLVDDIAVTRDLGPSDDTLNEETGELESPDATAVWSGVGAVLPINGQLLEDPQVSRVVDETQADYRLLRPRGSDPIAYGDLVRVTSVNGVSSNPRLVDQLWKVVKPPTPASVEAVDIAYLAEQRVAEQNQTPTP